MQTAINASLYPEMAFSLDGLTSRPFDGGYQLLPSLRPLWGLLPRSRGYNIRPVRTPHQHGMASMLVQQMYTWRGYSTEAVGLRPDDPNRVTPVSYTHLDVYKRQSSG